MDTFKRLTDDPDVKWNFIDGSIIKSYQYSSVAVGDGDQGIGKNWGDLTTTIHMGVDLCAL